MQLFNLPLCLVVTPADLWPDNIGPVLAIWGPWRRLFKSHPHGNEGQLHFLWKGPTGPDKRRQGAAHRQQGQTGKVFACTCQDDINSDTSWTLLLFITDTTKRKHDSVWRDWHSCCTAKLLWYAGHKQGESLTRSHRDGLTAEKDRCIIIM